jgi:hypothetical protein
MAAISRIRINPLARGSDTVQLEAALSNKLKLC